MRLIEAARRIQGPVKLDPMHLKCWIYGLRDGWNQPHELSSSISVEWLTGDACSDALQESLDRGISVGQFLRSPFHCEKYWKDPWDQ